MVKRIFTVLNKEVRGLHEAAYLLAFFSFISQLLALVRDRMLAHSFGAGQSLDIYYAAFKVPDFITAFIASAVSISVLVPFIIERFGKSQEEEKRFVNSIFTVFIIAIVVVSVIAFIFAPQLLAYLYKGIQGEALSELILLTRILLLQPILLGVSNFLGSITQAHQRFLPYAVSPVVYNLGIVIGIAWLLPIFGLPGIVYGVLIGAALHLALQIPFVVEKKLFPQITKTIDWVSTKKVFLLSLPRTCALSLSTLSLVVLTSFASRMMEGSISIFSLSWNLQSVTLSIVGVSYSLAAFPTLSRFVTEGNLEKFAQSIVTSLRHIIFWTLPFSVLFIVLRAQVVRTVLGSGSFDWNDTRLTAACLALFTVSALAQGVILLLVRGYYAAGMTKKPLYINIVGAVLIVLFSYGFMGIFNHFPVFAAFIESLLRVQDLEGTSVLMLALGYTCATILNALILWFIFSRDFKGVSRVVGKVFMQTFAAAVIMGFVAYEALTVFALIFDLSTLVGIFLQGLCAGLVGIAVFVAVLKLIRNKEIDDVWKALHAKITSAKVVVSDKDVA
jgi:putative peptidoglycan lipid II flippase